MNLILERDNAGIWLKTKHGSEDRDQAIEQMAILCGKEISAFQKLGKRATIEAGNWDGKLVFRVIGNSQVLKVYGIEK